jgi:catechol 2,3-dioxygenase-like lactoylglutathione lyase family enzyme
VLATADAVANVAVKDLETARLFYQETLGLKPIHRQGDEVIVFRSGNSQLNVYRSEYAGTNQATAVTWNVGPELDALVSDLKSKGVKFEHYNMPGLKIDGDIHSAGEMKVAWFKDPDGNILNLINQKE